jgi:phosphopantetheinyl transferase
MVPITSPRTRNDSETSDEVIIGRNLIEQQIQQQLSQEPTQLQQISESEDDKLWSLRALLRQRLLIAVK